MEIGTVSADACNDVTAIVGQTVTLDGGGSVNSYGKSSGLSYTWKQLSGPPVTLENSAGGDPNFFVPYDMAVGTTLEFELTVTDKGGDSDTDKMTVTVISVEDANKAPVFIEGGSATREVAENSPAGTNVGTPLTATDPDGNTLTYSLSGDDAASFGIDAATGQLTTVSGVTYDYETKSTYAVTVTATVTGEESDSLSASIAVTVSLTTPSPTACAGDDLTGMAGVEVTLQGTCNTNLYGEWWQVQRQRLGEESGAWPPDGTPSADIPRLPAATRRVPAGAAPTYSLSGTDADSFDISSTTGQLTPREGIGYDLNPKTGRRCDWGDFQVAVGRPQHPAYPRRGAR